MNQRWSVVGIAVSLAACSARVVDTTSAGVRDPASGSGGNVSSSDAGTATGSVNGTGGTNGAGGIPFMGIYPYAGGRDGVSGREAGTVDAPSVRCDFDDGSHGAARVDMNALCGPELGLDCKETPVHLLGGWVCAPTYARPPFSATVGFPIVRTVGCNYETIEWNQGYGGPSWTFSLSTGKLVGGRLSSDTNFGPCNSFSYEAGAIVDCPIAKQYLCAKPSDLVPDAGVYAGCRAATDPGCETCCVENLDENICTINDTAGGSSTYWVHSSWHDGPCDRACRPCALCSSVEEAALRALPDRPECDCSRPPGPDACGADDCECWCSKIARFKEHCAGVR